MSSSRPKILILGHARHGKDTVCEILRDKFGFVFISSSQFCAENIIFPVLRLKYGYNTVEQCFADRVNHRAEWFNLIRSYNVDDNSRLGRELFSENDIYCGLRSVVEMRAMKSQGIYDVSIWVDAGNRVPKEDSSSITITPSMADYVLVNDGTLEELEAGVGQLMTKILRPRD